MSATQHIQHRPFTWGVFFRFFYSIFISVFCFSLPLLLLVWFGSARLECLHICSQFAFIWLLHVLLLFITGPIEESKCTFYNEKKNRKSSHIFTFKHIHKTYSFTFLCIHLLVMQVIICYFSSFSFLFRESQRKLKSGQNNVDSKMLLRIKKNAKREMENRKRKEKSEKLRNLTMVKRLSTSNKFMCMHTHTFSFIYFYKCMCMLSVFFFYFELAHYVFVVVVTIQYIKIPFDRRMDRTNLKINMLRKVAFS